MVTFRNIMIRTLTLIHPHLLFGFPRVPNVTMLLMCAQVFSYGQRVTHQLPLLSAGKTIPPAGLFQAQAVQPVPFCPGSLPQHGAPESLPGSVSGCPQLLFMAQPYAMLWACLPFTRQRTSAWPQVLALRNQASVNKSAVFCGHSLCFSGTLVSKSCTFPFTRRCQTVFYSCSPQRIPCLHHHVRFRQADGRAVVSHRGFSFALSWRLLMPSMFHVLFSQKWNVWLRVLLVFWFDCSFGFGCWVLKFLGILWPCPL